MDFTLPTLTSLYPDMVNRLKERDVDAITWLDGSTSTNLPINSKRWNTANQYYENFNGTSWEPLASKYMINVDKIDGCTVNDIGTTNTDLWTAAKVLSELGTKLPSSSYTAADVLTKLKTVDGASSGLDADLLDGMHASSTNTVSTVVARDASGNFSAGTITGTLAGAATTLSTNRGNYKNTTDSAVVGELMWKNYGNGHTIFDASNSTTPTGVAKNNTNPDIPWGPTYPTLMGYNGYSTYGVRVDSSRHADYATTATKANTINNSGSALTFNWSGRGGQPIWLYGGNDPSNAYVYNPSNFSVNYANSAGYAATAAVGTNNTQIATTAFVNSVVAHSGNVGYTQSLAANGYQKLPSGLIIQWGSDVYASGAGGRKTVSFPIAFPNTCTSVVMTGTTRQGYESGSMWVAGKSAASFVYGNWIRETVFWVAIGY